MSTIRRTVGVYAGSFNPFHVGHANILHQAQEVFDEVVIAIGQNPIKENEREQFPFNNPILRDAGVVYFEGLLSDFLTKMAENGDEIFLVRGLRNGDDLQYEQNQLEFIKGMYPPLRTVFFICDKKFEHISSTVLRALKKISDSEYSKYVFTPVNGNKA